MKHSKFMRTGMVLALSTASMYANAYSSQDGLAACAEAMVSKLASRQGAPIDFNLDSHSASGKGKLGRRQVFHLDASSTDGDKVVARMDCVVNGKAEVTQLIPVPLDSGDARLRATRVY